MAAIALSSREWEQIRSSLVGFVCNRIGGEKWETEDIVQETLHTVVTKFDPSSSSHQDLVTAVRKHAQGIARNYLKNHWRKSGRNKNRFVHDISDEVIDKRYSSDETLAQKERDKKIRDAMDQLPEMYQRPLYMKYYLGKSSNEIAAALGIRATTVDTRLSRAREQLQQMIPNINE